MAVYYGGYYDESGDDATFAVAGFIAPYDTWVHLDWAWRDLLKVWNVDYFKASECVNGLEQFAQYRDNPLDVRSRLKSHEWEKLQQAYKQFGGLILKHSDYLRGSGAVAYLKDFQRIIAEDPKAHALFMDHPYYLCLQAALHASTDRVFEENVKRSSDDKIYIKPIFDSHEEYSNIAKIAYEKFREKNKRAATVLLPLDYEDDISTPALQVADMFAYEARKHGTNLERSPEKEMRPEMERLLPIVEKVKRLDYATLKLIVANQRPD
jgi:Protein of unknown function (DUF3800)